MSMMLNSDNMHSVLSHMSEILSYPQRKFLAAFVTGYFTMLTRFRFVIIFVRLKTWYKRYEVL